MDARFDREDQAAILKGIDIVRIIAVARRHAKTIAYSALIGFALFAVYAFLADVKYTAQVSVLVGDRPIRSIQDFSTQPIQGAETVLVDNETQVFNSERVLLSTIDALNLTEDSEFNGTDTPSLPVQAARFVMALNPLRWILPSKPDPDPAYTRLRIVVTNLDNAINVTRAGKSNVLQIAVTSKNPKKAAVIANGLADAYVREELKSRLEAGRRASDWLRTRLQELRQQSIDAAHAAEEYRSKNGLLATNGQLLTDQQLAQLSTDLAQANADLVRKQTRYDNLKALVDAGGSAQSIPETLDNATITSLHQKLIDVNKRYDEMVSKIGPKHEQSVALQQQKKQYEKMIFDELGRYLVSYSSELSVAQERQKTLQAQLEAYNASSAGSKESLVKLQQLEQEATVAKSVYQDVLQRYQQTAQQESLPSAGARIITDATAPLLPSEPRKPLLAAAGALLGLGFGISLAAFRELYDRGYRTAEQIEEELGVEVLGMLPRVTETQSDGAVTGLRGVRAQGPEPVVRYALKHPFSSYAETLRALKVTIDRRCAGGGSKTIGFVSSMPREGKSTISLNFAELLALQGNRVILIDADLRRAGLTQLTGQQPRAGLGEVLLNQAQFTDVLMSDPEGNVSIVPATVKKSFFMSSDLISSPAMKALLAKLSALYDYVIVDLPPIGPVVDGRAAASLLDATVLIVEWGEVPRRTVKIALGSSPTVQEKLVGVLLNKVDPQKIRTYEPYGLDDKQALLYGKYYG